MDEITRYETFLRDRIAELGTKNGISEHKLSLELGKSGSYIRSITSGAALPSVRELFNIMTYFDMSPPEFFEGLEDETSIRAPILEKVRVMGDEDLKKVSLFIEWITK